MAFLFINSLICKVFCNFLIFFDKNIKFINVNGKEYVISATNINDTLVEYMGEMTPLMYASVLGNLEVVKHLRVFGNGDDNIFILID